MKALHNALLHLEKYLFNKSRLNLFTTLYFNFRTLPFKQAVRLPIYMYGSWSFASLQGKVTISSNCIHRGMHRFGYNFAAYATSTVNTLNFYKGSNLKIYNRVVIGQGVNITIYPNAILDIGDRNTIGDFVRIICSKHIKTGFHTGITWECQVMDYNSHFVLDLDGNKISSISKPIVLGDYCWVCNRTTIMPGTVLPNRIIVASGSLLNRNYAKLDIPERSLIGGSPAKLIKTGVYRIYNRENESWLKQYFSQNSQEQCLNINDISKFEE